MTIEWAQMQLLVHRHQIYALEQLLEQASDSILQEADMIMPFEKLSSWDEIIECTCKGWCA